MKKILLIIAITFCIFQLVVLAIDIDIGSPAINRAASLVANVTVINKNNPANDTGTITSIEVWADENLSNLEVATFYETAANEFSTRGTHFIGNVTSGSKQTFPGLNIPVEAGDYLGYVFTVGKIDYDVTGGIAYWWLSGDAIPCTEQAFDFAGGTGIMSLYGTGATVGWDHKWNTKTISKWNTKEFSKWNGLE